ncbi:MAG: hypothetical protein WC356_02895 [Candidatus Micrarchaeia archaeon]|jgi:hypothetical protein
MIEFSEHGNRIFAGTVKLDFGFNFVNKDNVKQTESEPEKMGIIIKKGQK